MEKIKGWINNLSLRKSIAFYIVIFVALALLLGNATAGLCDSAVQKINEKYASQKEKYYLTNEEGEQLGEGTYIWKEDSILTENDENLLKLLNMIPMVMYPLYSALGVAAASLFFYKSKLKRPLELLTEASEKISKNELDFSVEYENQDEMGDLCRSFEIMRSALEENQTEMWRSMEERKRLNAAFAHDLRTPLTVLKGYNEMIRLSGGENEKKTADIMAKHIKRMENYVESMSSIRRLEDRELSCQEIKMQEFMASLENSGAIYCEKNGKNFSFAGSVFTKRMVLDSELILEVYHNLLSNGVRFAEKEVAVTVRETEKGIMLDVTDDGSGFSENALKKAAEPYYHEKKKEPCQKEKSVSEDHFGLGLYICKTLCRQHGGDLKISNGESGAKVTAFFQKFEKS